MLLVALATSVAQARPPVVHSPDLQIPFDPTLVRVGGARHLVYELHLTNLRPVDLQLTRVEVIASGASLADFSGAELARWLGRPGAPASDPPDRRIVRGGGRAVLYLWLALDDRKPAPSTVRHRIEFERLQPQGRERGVVDGVVAHVRQERAIVLDPPVRGGPWVALYDPAMVGGHRTAIYTIDGRARIPGRFAVDLVKLDRRGARARGDTSRVANWYGYGADVLAVADATVADARDDMPGHASIATSQGAIALEKASGNYVALDLGGGRHAFYEHLQQGSVLVQRGDRVRRGQVIARLGNTGSSSSGPHLHFHVSDAASPLAAEGLPFELRRFRAIGAFDSIAAATRGERWKPPPPGRAGPRQDELPAPNAVIVFP